MRKSPELTAAILFAAAIGAASAHASSGVAAEPTDSAVLVTARTLGVTLDKKGAVTRLVTAHGADLGPETGSVPLFVLKLTRVDNFTNSVTVDANAARACVTEKTADAVRFIYADLGEACVRVTCTVRAVGDYVRWGIDVRPNPGWALEETTYPRIVLSPALGGEGTDDALVVGRTKGGLVRNPCARGRPWWCYGQEPGDLAAQFATLYDARAGFYFAAEDANGHPKRLGAECNRDGLVFYSRRFGFDAGAVRQPYEIVTGGFEGTPADPCAWQDAADLYKKWAVRQRWCAKTLKARDDLPAWMKDAPAMVRFTREALKKPETIRRWMSDYWQKMFPSAPLVMAFWGWEKHGCWVGPDYFPVVPDNATFAALVRDMKSMNAHAYPWPSGYRWALTYGKRQDGSFVWDDRVRFERTALPHGVVTREGLPFNLVPSWLRGGSSTCLCGGDPWTVDWWNREVCLPLAKLGCEMLQVDQIVGGSFPCCWAKGHPHRPGEGRWKTEAFRRQLETMRETMRTCEPGAVVSYEEPDELFNDRIGIQDYRDCESRGDEWASVFNYLYHEYVPCFQSNMRRGNRIWQAHAAVDGQIPFLLPAAKDAKPDSGAYDAFVRRWVELYHNEARDFLAFGRQIKPPRLVCGTQPYSMTFYGGIRQTGRKPTVFCAAYESADGRRAVILANATGEPQTATLYRNGMKVQIVLQPDEIRQM